MGAKTKRRTKRFLALCITALLLAASLAGCGKKEEKKGTDGKVKQEETGQQGENKAADSDDNKEETENASDTKEWSWPLAEKKELSIWLAWNNDYADTPNDLIGIKKIEENTNVHINWITVLAAEAQEKFGLLMASGDHPDILRGVESYYTGGLVQMCSDGVIVELTDYIPQYMPVYQALRTSNEKLKRDTVTDDGRMVGVYTIASNNGVIQGERVWDGLCIRQDWLDELNMEVPVTIDDWYKVLKAFKEQYQCEAPLMIGAQNAYDISHNFLSAYGVLGEFYNDNGTVKYGPLEDGYRQWVELFRQWYAEGLIDPNFITNNADYMGPAEYLGTGRAGAAPNIWDFTADSLKTHGYNKEEKFFLRGVTSPVLNEGDTPQIGFAPSELTKETVSITKNCKDLELACRYLDYWYTEECMFLDSLGIEGESYIDNGDGTYSLSDSLKQQVADGKYPTLQVAISQYILNQSDFGLYNWARFDPINEGVRALEACEIWNEAKCDLLLPPCMTNTEEELIAYNNLYTSILTLKKEATIKFITGTKPMEEYDAFLADLRNYGIEECIQYKQAALDRYNAR